MYTIVDRPSVTPSTAVAINGTDADRARLDIVTLAVLTVLDEAGRVRLSVMDWTTGYHYGVTPEDVDRESERLAAFGDTVLHVTWGEYSPVSGDMSVSVR